VCSFSASDPKLSCLLGSKRQVASFAHDARKFSSSTQSDAVHATFKASSTKEGNAFQLATREFQAHILQIGTAEEYNALSIVERSAIKANFDKSKDMSHMAAAEGHMLSLYCTIE